MTEPVPRGLDGGEAGVDVGRVGCVLIPSFPLACELDGQPELWSRPVAVRHPDENTVWATTPTAGAQGVTVGLRVSEAIGRCPALMVLDARASHYERTWTGLLDALEAVTPAVEPVELGVAYIELIGLFRSHGSPARLYRTLLEGLPDALFPRLGVGPTKFVARLAAVRAEATATNVVGDGELARALAAVPVGELPVDPEVIRRLRLVGISTLGALAALPRRVLVAQFGREGARLADLLDGSDQPVRPRQRPETLVERLAVDEPLVTRQAVLTVGAQLLERLLRRLRHQQRAARQVAVAVESDEQRWDRTVTLRRPRHEHDDLWAAVAPVIERAQLPGPVSALSLELRGLCAPPGVQDELFARRATVDEAGRERIEVGLRQLRARYGRCPVGRIIPLDPHSRLPERRWAVIDHE